MKYTLICLLSLFIYNYSLSNDSVLIIVNEAKYIKQKRSLKLDISLINNSKKIIEIAIPNILTIYDCVFLDRYRHEFADDKLWFYEMTPYTGVEYGGAVPNMRNLFNIKDNVFTLHPMSTSKTQIMIDFSFMYFNIISKFDIRISGFIEKRIYSNYFEFTPNQKLLKNKRK